MDKEVEERFVKKFIKKENRERTLYELNSVKKRKQVIHRLINLLDKKYAVLYESKISDEEVFLIVKKYYNLNKDCYVIADSTDDGTVIPFKEAFLHMSELGADYLIICGDNTVVMKEEISFGTPAKIILHYD